MTTTSGTANAAAAWDWSEMPEDLMLTVMAGMEVPDLVRSGAVCTSWRSAFAAFRRLGLPSRRQPPCLLYSHGHSRADAACTMYSPSTHAALRVHLTADEANGVVCSANSWVLVTDDDANLHLVDPLTGDRAALPPVTTLERVKSSATGDDGGLVYNVDFQSVVSVEIANDGGGTPDIQQVTARRARTWMYHRIAMSGSPSAAGGCVVLLVHMPHQQISFARPGDERWTSLANHVHLLLPPWLAEGIFHDAVYNPTDGLFYVLRDCGALFSLDLIGSSPVAKTKMYTMAYFYQPIQSWYLAAMPCGNLLIVERRWRKTATTLDGTTDISHDPRVVAEDERMYDVNTTEIKLRKLHLLRSQAEHLAGVGGDHALFLGPSAAVCLPVKDYPVLRRNCAYLTDDSDQLQPPFKRLDLGVWDFESGRLQKLHNLWPLHHPWRDSPPPIWITPPL